MVLLKVFRPSPNDCTYNQYNSKFFFTLAGGIIKDMSSTNEVKARVGMLRAEELLGDGEKTWDEGSLKTVLNGTKINRKAFEDLGKPKEEMPADAGSAIHWLCIIMRVVINL